MIAGLGRLGWERLAGVNCVEAVLGGGPLEEPDQRIAEGDGGELGESEQGAGRSQSARPAHHVHREGLRTAAAIQ